MQLTQVLREACTKENTKRSRTWAVSRKKTLKSSKQRISTSGPSLRNSRSASSYIKFWRQEIADYASNYLLKNKYDQTLPIGKEIIPIGKGAFRSCLAASGFIQIILIAAKIIMMRFIRFILLKMASITSRKVSEKYPKSS